MHQAKDRSQRHQCLLDDCRLRRAIDRRGRRLVDVDSVGDVVDVVAGAPDVLRAPARRAMGVQHVWIKNRNLE